MYLMKQAGFFAVLHEKNQKIDMIKKGSTYLRVSTPLFNFQDILSYLGSGKMTLERFLESYGDNNASRLSRK